LFIDLTRIFRHLAICWSFSPVSANKKGPRGSLFVAHGRISPGGYTALPTRLPTTRMVSVFIGAHSKRFAGQVNLILTHCIMRVAAPVA
jgi:hypothetical protein